MSTTHAARCAGSRRASRIAGSFAAGLAVAGGFAAEDVRAQERIRINKVIEAVEEGRPAIAGQDWRFVDMEHSPFSSTGIDEVFAEMDQDRDEAGRLRLDAAGAHSAGRRRGLQVGRQAGPRPRRPRRHRAARGHRRRGAAARAGGALPPDAGRRAARAARRAGLGARPGRPAVGPGHRPSTTGAPTSGRSTRTASCSWWP